MFCRPTVTAGPWILGLGLTLGLSGTAHAHFQELVPDLDILDEGTGNQVELQLRFTHPMAGGPLMDMAPPVRFGVVGPDGDQDLRETLIRVDEGGQGTYRAQYRVTAPGDHTFYLEPAPYWEPAEGVMIIHYTKVVVDGFGGGEGWETPVGLPVEIDPLVRPYGLWTGNLFRGIVRQDGEPVPFAEVEVEWRNDGTFVPPADTYVTQVVKADANGVFAYAMPRAGWWGFAALIEDEEAMRNPEGEAVPVERGGLIWVRTRDMR